MQSEVRANDPGTIRPYKHNDSNKIQMNGKNDPKRIKTEQ